MTIKREPKGRQTERQTDRQPTVRVRVQLWIPREGEREENHVIESWKLHPLKLITGELERTKDREL